MITLPIGFDYVTFVGDLLACVAPFIPIMMMIVAYKIFKKAAKGV